MTSIKYQTGNVFFRHFRELLGKEGFETDETNEVGALAVILDDGMFDFVVGVGWPR